MRTLKQYKNLAMVLGFAVLASACDKNDDKQPDPILVDGDEAYVIGVGVGSGSSSSHYLVQAKDLLSGKISLLNNGILQEGYREYLNINNFFYAIGGLGVHNVDAYYIANDNQLTAKTGLSFDNGADDYMAVGNGKTLLGVKVATDANYDGNVEFTTIDTDNYSFLNNKTTVSVKDIYVAKDKDHGWSHSGLAISGNKAFQTIFPISSSSTGWATPNVDTTYVAVYSYPEFKLEKVIKDTRTGPAGAPVNISGIFATESGDVYTIFHAGYGFDHKNKLKDPAILRIKAGTDVFDQDYYFKTEGIPNGGKIIKATYVGNNKLLAQMYTKEQATQWDQKDLTYAIVDLVEQRITAVKNSPVYEFSESAFVDGDKAYVPAKVGATLNIYQIDIPTATATKGVEIEASFVKGIGKLKKQ